MKKIWNMLKSHVLEDFRPKVYGRIALLLFILLTFNYYFDFEDDYIDTVDPFYRIPAKFLWFFIPYLLACLIVFIGTKKNNVLKSLGFWSAAIFIIIAMALDSGFPVYEWLIKDNFSYQAHLFLNKVVRNLINIPFVIGPAFLFYYFTNTKNNFYGVTAKFDIKPYFFLLLMMIPILFLASQVKNFSDFYPMYQNTKADEYWGISENWLILMYELVYGWNFFSVEFIFRGFLVIGLSKYAGKEVILPMIVLYCVYHFGKPMGEAISSIFGGYILGVIALYSRSIFGGVLLHLGIAWLMEIFGFIYH